MENSDILKNSPIYAMSLGSHELFHSNLWAWLMQNYKKSIKDVFGFEIEEDAVKSVEREAKNIDITITTNDEQKYIIENKFKSIPYKAQLEIYKEKLGKKFAKGKLACIVEPKFVRECRGWDVLTYSTIIKNLKEFIDKNDTWHGNNDKCILAEYVKVTELAIEMITKNLDGETLKISAEDFSEYEKYRISDILRKLIASKFEAYLIENLKSKFTNLYICSDYAHKKGIINAFFLKTTDDATNKTHSEIIKKALYEFAIGVQIEGHEFRVIVCSAGKNRKKHEELFKNYSDKRWFDATYKKGNAITLLNHEYTTTMSPKEGGKFNKYTEAKYNFVHQFFTLPNNNFSEVCSLMEKFLSKAEELL